MRRVDIKGFEGLYAVSDDGRVWAYPKASRSVGRWLKLQVLKSGYVGVCLFKDGKRFYPRVHALVATAFLGPRPTPTHQVNHKSGIKTENSVDNLEWATPLENMQHAFATGLHTVRAASLKVSVRGQERLLRELCAEHDIPFQRARDRIITLGWPVDLALSAPRFYRPSKQELSA